MKNDRKKLFKRKNVYCNLKKLYFVVFLGVWDEGIIVCYFFVFDCIFTFFIYEIVAYDFFRWRKFSMFNFFPSKKIHFYGEFFFFEWRIFSIIFSFLILYFYFLFTKPSHWIFCRRRWRLPFFGMIM